jgi:hypothetical protein
MKKEAEKLAAYYGCTTKYSGRTRTMYVHGDNSKDAVVAIRAYTSRFNVTD